MSTVKTIALIYFIGGLFTAFIGAFRAAKNKQTLPPSELDALSWFIMWWMYLPIFSFRWIKYKLRGKSL